MNWVINSKRTRSGGAYRRKAPRKGGGDDCYLLLQNMERGCICGERKWLIKIIINSSILFPHPLSTVRWWWWWSFLGSRGSSSSSSQSSSLGEPRGGSSISFELDCRSIRRTPGANNWWWLLLLLLSFHSLPLFFCSLSLSLLLLLQFQTMCCVKGMGISFICCCCSFQRHLPLETISGNGAIMHQAMNDATLPMRRNKRNDTQSFFFVFIFTGWRHFYLR